MCNESVPYSDACNACVFSDSEQVVLVTILFIDAQFLLQCYKSSEQTRSVDYVVMIGSRVLKVASGTLTEMRVPIIQRVEQAAHRTPQGFRTLVTVPC